MVFTSTETKDVDAPARTLQGTTSWMDWWFYTANYLVMCDVSERAKVWCFFVTSARMQLLVAKTASTIRANSVLKHCITVLGKVRDNISCESFISSVMLTTLAQLICSRMVS